MDQAIVEDIIKKVVAQLARPDAAPVRKNDAIPVELSARHAHLDSKDVEALFNGKLTFKQKLSQPGQFLCNERVRLIGPRGIIDNVAVLGPPRDKSQVEISLTDARILGVDTPVRQSGDIAGSPGIVLASSKGIVGIEEGLIVAGRHIHMTAEDAKRLNVMDMEKVCVHMNSARPAVFEDVLVRINENFRLAMHIDYDEANSCGWDDKATCKIIKSNEGVACGFYGSES